MKKLIDFYLSLSLRGIGLKEKNKLKRERESEKDCVCTCVCSTQFFKVGNRVISFFNICDFVDKCL